MTSIKAVEGLVQRTEAAMARVHSVAAQSQHVQLPDPPTPLTLELVEEWVATAEECCRRPLIAESKRLFKEKGLDAAAIPAHILSKPELISESFKRIEGFPPPFHKPALVALNSALTKGFDDAVAVVASFAAAANELAKIDELRMIHGWACDLAAVEASAYPASTSQIVEKVRKVCQCSDLATKNGVQIRNFSDLEAASGALGSFSLVAQNYSKAIIAEGLPSDGRVSVAGQCLEEATKTIEQALVAVTAEKAQLKERAATLQRELKLIGGHGDAFGGTIAELRKVVEDLNQALSLRRRELQSSLGESVYLVVQSICEGNVPLPEQVSDDELGAAIRKAVECGYDLSLEPPIED